MSLAKVGNRDSEVPVGSALSTFNCPSTLRVLNDLDVRLPRRVSESLNDEVGLVAALYVLQKDEEHVLRWVVPDCSALGARTQDGSRHRERTLPEVAAVVQRA